MRKLQLIGTLVLLLVPMMAGLASPSPSSVYAQESAVQPGVGGPGTTFKFFSTGFNTREAVRFWLHGPDGNVVNTGDDVTSNGDGRADWSWKSPGDAMPGNWQMVARGAESGIEQTIVFEIRLGAPVIGDSGQPVENPETGVNPVIGSPGTTFSFYARGFADGEQVGFWLNAPDGRVVSTGEQVTVKSNSRADWQWVSPVDAVPGVWQMVAKGVNSNRQVVILFEIR